MPAAAVIPAPIAYIKVVAVKKLVVVFLVARLESRFLSDGHPSANHFCTSLYGVGSRHFTLKKLECFRQVSARIH